jgi:hypothetical protein
MTTRRNAISTALTGLLAAGATSILPTTTQAAPEPTTVFAILDWPTSMLGNGPPVMV